MGKSVFRDEAAASALSCVFILYATRRTPRVGNPDFVTYFDSLISDFTRVNNEKDLIPTLPGRFLGFQHPKTEVHIVSGTDAIYCLDGSSLLTLVVRHV